MSPALLQADCALSAFPLSRLPSLPATFAVLWYFKVVLILVYYTCSSLVSPGAFMPAIVLTFIIILILVLILVLRTFLSLLLVV